MIEFKSMMRTCLLFIGILMTVLACNSHPLSGKDEHQLPITSVKIICDNVDIGTPAIGDTIQIEYVLQNTGDSPLVIQEVLPSCECTTTRFDKRAVPPGGLTTITLIYHVDNVSEYWYRTAEVLCNSDTPLNLIFTSNTNKK